MPGANAEVSPIRACALCGGPTNLPLVPTPAPLNRLPGLPACEAHQRVLREAVNSESPSTVISRRGDGGSMALRAYGKRGRVMVVSCSTAPGDATLTATAALTPREARRFAGALIRAARLATGETDLVARA